MEILNLKGFKCPVPLMKTQTYCNSDEGSSCFKVLSDDPDSIYDFEYYFESNRKYRLTSTAKHQGIYEFTIEKAS